MEYLTFLAFINAAERSGNSRVETIICLYRHGMGCIDPLTQKQCAEAAGVSMETVTNTINNALLKIRGGLDDD